MTTLIIAVILLALLFDFLNGIHDSSNIVATMISSRAFSPLVALGITALAEFSGPFIFGVAVATTIGHEVVIAEAISTQVLIAALISAILWNLLTWYLGFPSSSSHALIGGFVGAVLIGAGWQAHPAARPRKGADRAVCVSHCWLHHRLPCPAAHLYSCPGMHPPPSIPSSKRARS